MARTDHYGLLGVERKLAALLTGGRRERREQPVQNRDLASLALVVLATHRLEHALHERSKVRREKARGPRRVEIGDIDLVIASDVVDERPQTFIDEIVVNAVG